MSRARHQWTLESRRTPSIVVLQPTIETQDFQYLWKNSLPAQWSVFSFFLFTCSVNVHVDWHWIARYKDPAINGRHFCTLAWKCKFQRLPRINTPKYLVCTRIENYRQQQQDRKTGQLHFWSNRRCKQSYYRSGDILIGNISGWEINWSMTISDVISSVIESVTKCSCGMRRLTVFQGWFYLTYASDLKDAFVDNICLYRLSFMKHSNELGSFFSSKHKLYVLCHYLIIFRKDGA